MSENHASLDVASSDDLDVRRFTVKQGLSELFHVGIVAVSNNHDIDFDEVIGKPASFSLRTHWSAQTWEGVCSQIEQVRVDTAGLATYTLAVEPRAWLMTQRRNYRIFQFETELDIVKTLLSEWGIPFEVRVDPGNYKPRKYRCQYAESDFAFVSRMLEDCGVSYCFEQRGASSVMILDDAPHSRELQKPLLRFHDSPGVTDGEFVTRVGVAQRVRPGTVTFGDLDYRRSPETQPRLSATRGLPQEARLEQFLYEPGAFLYEQGAAGGSTPTADDRGASRTDEQLGRAKTDNRLLGERGDSKRVTFDSNALDLVPGVILSVTNHPHRILAMDNTLLVREAVIEGDHDGDWRAHVEVVPTREPVRPELKTPRPKVQGLESGTIVGPAGEEIHTDEYGRVRVHFHWDRAGTRDERASCWIPSSQPWAGSSFGGVNLPRVGQEVLVEFLGGDPDRPVVVGRVYTETNPPPYKLPDFKKVSGLRSETSPRLVSGGSGDELASPLTSILGGQAVPLGQEGIVDSLAHPFFDASSPDAQTHQWHGNELSFFDQPENQQLYMQAQRDMKTVVKNDQTTIVGNVRSTRVGTDDILFVGHKQLNVILDNQTTSVAANRLVSVTGRQDHAVVEDITVFGGKNQTYTITETFKSTAKVHHFVSEEKTILQVGTSTIVMQPNFIVIQADDVFINPGPEDTKKAIDGQRPEKPEERQAREQAEALAAEQAAFDQAMQDPAKKAAYERFRDGLAQDAANNAAGLYGAGGVSMADLAIQDASVLGITAPELYRWNQLDLMRQGP